MAPIYLELFVVCLGIILLFLESFRGSEQNKATLVWIAVGGLSLVLAATFFCNPQAMSTSPFYASDRLALFYKQFILIATILVLLMSLPYIRTIQQTIPSCGAQGGVGEFFILPVFACVGMMWLVSAKDFVFLFVALELTTLAFYVLVAYMRRSIVCLEAGIKYFILGAFSTGFLVYGISWVFGVTGQTNFEQISHALGNISSPTALLFGLGLILLAVGFKIGAFPFQFWVPDVYQGAPTPVTAYLSVASKAAGFVVLLRIVETFAGAKTFSPNLQLKIFSVLSVMAALTVLFGNLTALLQTNVKRLLAYSSIAHAGFLLIGMASLHAPSAPKAISFYLGAYLLMTMLAFFVIVLVSVETGGEEISNFRGLAKRSPILAGSMLIALLSLAGIPFTAGFFGKFFIFMSAIEAHQWLLVALGALGVCCGFYYYLKIIEAMYWQSPISNVSKIEISSTYIIILMVLCIVIVLLGIAPQLLLDFI